MSSRVAYRAALAVAVGAGVLARFWNVRDQVAGYDELHAVRSALALPVGTILVTYQKNDNCLPLTALYRLWMDAGQPLTEMVLRAPVLLCGVLMLWALPQSVARLLGKAPALALAFLLALSPLLVIYSRIARSYVPIALFAFLAAVAFFDWWQGAGRHKAAFYVLFASLSVFFHLLAAPLVLAPLAFAACDLVARRQVPERPRLAALATLALAVGIALAAFLLPARESLGHLFESKGGEGSLSSESILGMARLWTGTRAPALVGLFWATAAVGLAVLISVKRLLGVYTLVLVAAQAAVLVLLSPFRVEYPVIFSRYMLVALPLVLLWIATALTEPWIRRRHVAARAVSAGAASVFVAALALCGPLADPAVRASSFPHANDYLDYSRPYPTLRRDSVPAFYLGPLEPGPIAEAPWPTSAKFGRSLLVYERCHGRRVLVVCYDEALDDRRLLFRNLLASPQSILASEARYLVLHANLAAEEARLPEYQGAPADPGHAAAEAEYQRLWSADFKRRLAAEWGPPDREDARVAVWDLARVRARSGG